MCLEEFERQSCIRHKPLNMCVTLRKALWSKYDLTWSISHSQPLSVPFWRRNIWWHDFYHLFLCSFLLQYIKKNPANGRQSISRPMWIVAPIPQLGWPRIPKNPFFLKNAKYHPNCKTQKRLEICQNFRYTLRPKVSHPSGSMVSNMFLKAKSAKKN